MLTVLLGQLILNRTDVDLAPLLLGLEGAILFAIGVGVKKSDGDGAERNELISARVSSVQKDNPDSGTKEEVQVVGPGNFNNFATKLGTEACTLDWYM